MCAGQYRPSGSGGSGHCQPSRRRPHIETTSCLPAARSASVTRSMCSAVSPAVAFRHGLPGRAWHCGHGCDRMPGLPPAGNHRRGGGSTAPSGASHAARRSSISLLVSVPCLLTAARRLRLFGMGCTVHRRPLQSRAFDVNAGPAGQAMCAYQPLCVALPARAAAVACRVCVPWPHGCLRRAGAG